MKTIAVTGGAGFIGSEFVRQAVKRGYHVAVIDKLTYAGDVARLAGAKHDFYQVDIVDHENLLSALRKIKPEAIVNFAAETHVDRSLLDPDSARKTNEEGTKSLAEACSKLDIKRFVHISTDEVYGAIQKGESREFKEPTPESFSAVLEATSPYSISKAEADKLLWSYRTKLPFVIVRPCNNYGPWQYPEKFIPVIIYKALKNQKIPVYGKGENVREWLYVSDCAEAILKIMESKGHEGEVYNIGSGDERPNIEIVRIILTLMKKDEDLIEFVQDRPNHDFRYSLNSDKFRRDFDWTPKEKFALGIQKTIAHYEKNIAWLEKKAADLQDFWKQVYKKV